MQTSATASSSSASSVLGSWSMIFESIVGSASLGSVSLVFGMEGRTLGEAPLFPRLASSQEHAWPW